MERKCEHDNRYSQSVSKSETTLVPQAREQILPKNFIKFLILPSLCPLQEHSNTRTFTPCAADAVRLRSSRAFYCAKYCCLYFLPHPHHSRWTSWYSSVLGPLCLSITAVGAELRVLCGVRTHVLRASRSFSFLFSLLGGCAVLPSE